MRTLVYSMFLLFFPTTCLANIENSFKQLQALHNQYMPQSDELIYHQLGITRYQLFDNIKNSIDSLLPMTNDAGMICSLHHLKFAGATYVLDSASLFEGGLGVLECYSHHPTPEEVQIAQNIYNFLNQYIEINVQGYKEARRLYLQLFATIADSPLCIYYYQDFFDKFSHDFEYLSIEEPDFLISYNILQALKKLPLSREDEIKRLQWGKIVYSSIGDFLPNDTTINQAFEYADSVVYAIQSIDSISKRLVTWMEQRKYIERDLACFRAEDSRKERIKDSIDHIYALQYHQLAQLCNSQIIAHQETFRAIFEIARNDNDSTAGEIRKTILRKSLAIGNDSLYIDNLASLFSYRGNDLGIEEQEIFVAILSKLSQIVHHKNVRHLRYLLNMAMSVVVYEISCFDEPYFTECYHILCEIHKNTQTPISLALCERMFGGDIYDSLLRERYEMMVQDSAIWDKDAIDALTESYAYALYQQGDSSCVSLFRKYVRGKPLGYNILKYEELLNHAVAFPQCIQPIDGLYMDSLIALSGDRLIMDYECAAWIYFYLDNPKYEVYFDSLFQDIHKSVVQECLYAYFNNSSERDTENMWIMDPATQNHIYDLAVNDFSHNAVVSTLACNLSLLDKSCLLNIERDLVRTISRLNPSLWSQYTSLYNRYLETHDINTLQRIVQIGEEIQDISLQNQSFSYSLQCDWKTIQKELHQNQYVIDFITYNHYLAHCTPADCILKMIMWKDYYHNYDHYAAICFSPQSTEPIIIPVPNVMDKDLVDLSPDIYNYTGLYKVFWDTIISTLNIPDGADIFFSPDRTLSTVAIEYALTTDSILMNEKYNMYRLSSIKEILNHNQNRVENIAAFGGLNYFIDDSLWIEASSTNKSSEYYRNRFVSPDSVLTRMIDDSTRAYNNIQFLPGTLNEVKEILGCFRQNHYNSYQYIGNDGTEEAIKSMSSHSPSILHIGTHGFYIKKSQINPSAGEKAWGENPMERTGLIMAGGGRAFQNIMPPPNVEDGILTSLEISKLDLSNTNLVVLSACQTALGDIISDGVSGLQRGFKKAGVQTIIMSLWPVDDKATQMLMTEFYTNWINHHQSKREAFKNAQNAVRYAVDEDGDRMFENPVFWAGFIMLD
ncbi:MAG: CHAT domain-containing protein [Prevotellaceae bacterium]|nr:CHAT domain-containing protein [Candidatus Faecinaster equi]